MTLTPDEAMRDIRAGARVVATPFCATPTTLLGALGRRAERVGNLSLASGALLGPPAHAAAAVSGNLKLSTWQPGGTTRELAEAGLIDYIPLRAGDVPAHLSSHVDVALIRVSPPDNRGVCSLGASASYGRALIDAAARVIAEVDDDFPFTYGDVQVSLDEIDTMVASDAPTPQYRAAAAHETARAIARHLTPRLPEDAVLQVGIGAVPETIAASVIEDGFPGRVRFLGLASDVMAPVMRDRDAEFTVAEILGSQEVMSAAHLNGRVQMVASSRIHNPRWLAGFPRLTSICSALQVDLSGQVASESVASRLVGGLGGSADFFDGSRLSVGGIRCIAMSSTTPSGASRVVAHLTKGSPVSLARYDVDLVVTEHGVADLRGVGLGERAERLTAVAHPDHREALWAEYATAQPTTATQ